MPDLSFFTQWLPSRLLVISLTAVLLVSCNQDPPPSSSTAATSPPRDGFGQKLGTDVTAQPGRSNMSASIDRPRIVAFGDSLTAGLGVSSDEAYPAQLQRRLEMDGYRYRVINAGVSGETTAGGLRRVSWILQSRPQLVILELGGNDGLRGLKVDETRANLDQMIRRLQEAKVPVVLAGMKLPPNYGADYAAQFEAIYPALAKQYGLPLVPFLLEGVAGSTTLNQADGIHPTAEGYQVIVANVMKAIGPLLRK